MDQEAQETQGVNGRQKVIMVKDGAGWYWYVRDQEDPEYKVYESLYFSTREDAEENLELAANLLEGYLPEPVFYIHDGQWWWQYHLRDATAPLLSAGSFPTEKRATENWALMKNLVTAHGKPAKKDND